MSISSFFGLETSLRGLLAQQRGLDVTSHNVTNANTPGYSRQEAVMVAAPPLSIAAGALQDGSGAQVGAGVDVESYRRVRDLFIDVQYRAQAMRLGEQEARSASLSQTEAVLAEPGGDGISAQLAKFWSAWGEFANAPESDAARQAVVSQAATLTDSFGRLDDQLATLTAQLGQQYAALTAPQGDIAAAADEIATLNDAITRAVSAGQQPNDLMDRRDQLLDQLATFAQVSVTDTGDGSVRVTFGDAPAPLVDGSTVTWPQTLVNPGGKLGALLELTRAGGTLDGYRTALGGAARTLADAVNGAYAPTGGAFFAYTAGAEASTLSIAVTPGTLRASATGAAGANEVALGIAALRGGSADATYGAFVTRIGSDARETARQQTNARVLVDALDDRRQSVAGVSIDEEMTNLVRFQRGYQASARAMSTMDEMLDVLINRTGRVGL